MMHGRGLPRWIFLLILAGLVLGAQAKPQHEMPAAAAAAPELVPGSMLVFESKRDGNWEIYSANDDGSAQQRLTAHPYSDLHPRANRGYTKIAFTSNRLNDNDNIFTINSDGSSPTPLTTSPADDLYPTWSPDGSRIAFTSDRTGNNDIFVMNADGSGVIPLTSDPGNDMMPHWSLFGDQIVFVSNRSGDMRIWKMAANGSGQTQLSVQPKSQDPVWSPDSTRIAYSADADGDAWHELWVMDADGSNQQLLYDAGENAEAEARGWSPDGRYISFSYLHWVYKAGGWSVDVQNLQAYDTYNPGTIIPLVTTSGADYGPDWQTVDILPPTTSVAPLPAEVPAVFTITWSGYENGPAGFKYYDVQIQDGAGPWQDLLVATTQTSITYHGTGGHTYSFRSRGHDYAYNTEAWPDQPDAVTTVDPYPPQTAVNPLAALSTYRFEVSWGGYDPGESGIVTYDVQVRDNDGPWTDWFVATTQTAAFYEGVGGHTYYFRSRAIDNAYNVEPWPDDPDGDTHTLVDPWPPLTLIAPLPDHYRGTQVQVRWGGYDPGDSEIAAYDVQYKDGNGAWTTWYTQTTATAASFTGALGHTYSFRCRATDYAHNVEAWPADPDGDTSITFYAWAIAGTARDNRETLLAGVSANTTPAAFEVLPSTLGGEYASYVSHTAGTYDVNWSKGGYTTLPDTAFGAQDASFDIILPPGDNVVQNWGFEAGQLAPAWLYSGVTLPDVTGTLRHTGDYAALLGCQEGDFAAHYNVSNLAGVSASPMGVIDGDGNLHVVWYQNQGGYSGEIFYARRTGGVWQPPENISNSPALAEAPQIAVDANGTVHVAWTEDTGGTPEIYYARRTGGSWSQPENVSQTPAGVSRNPQLAVQPNGATVHILWRDMTATPGVYNIYYAQRTTSWTTSGPLTTGTVSVDVPRLVVESNGTVHAVWSAGEVYYARRDGSWSTPVAISASPGTAGLARLALYGAQVHVLWTESAGGNHGLYYARYDGSWSAPQNVYSGAGLLAEPQLAVDGSGALHAVWRVGTGASSEIYYARRSGGQWSTAENISNTADESSAPQLAVDSTNAAHVVWVDKSAGNYEIAYRDRNGGVWSPLKNASRNAGSSDQPSLFVEGSKTAHLVWADTSLGAAVVLYAQAATNAAAGDSQIAQRVTVPGGMESPTLSFLYLLDGASSGMGSSLSVQVTANGDTTTLLSTSTSANDWTHRWYDLGDWAGQSITLTFKVTQAANRLCTWGYLDEVTIGGAYPDVWIAKTGGATGLPGGYVVYHITYGNRGGVAAAGVQITDLLPAALTYVTADPPPASTAPLTWAVGDLAAHGGPYQITLTAAVQAGAGMWNRYTNTASIATSTTEPETGNNTASAATLIGARVYLPLMTTAHRP